jgi:hypothetical protein
MLLIKMIFPKFMFEFVEEVHSVVYKK